jgi:23S rRNA (cytosine1962-C5)-methyltransferase
MAAFGWSAANMSVPVVILAPGREKSVLRRHPWIFSGAIARHAGRPGSGDTVAVIGADGTPLGWGAYSPASQIAVRMWTFEPGEAVDAGLFERRLGQALAARHALAAQADLDAFRLVNAESDRLPGLIVDRYAGFLICQFLTAGAERWKPVLADLLAALGRTHADIAGPVRGVYERSDVDVRGKEGLVPIVGALAGETPPDLVYVTEHGCRFAVDVCRGHKTGFYLDQRDNRALLSGYAAGADVLNCFAYTGAFGLYALRGGARRVMNVDTAASALDLAVPNVELNGFDPAQLENVSGDVFQVLRRLRDSARQFDLVVLDPPKFADSRAQLPRAARGYKDINLLAFKLLRPGGTLFTFSCSGLVTADLFQSIVAGAALDAGRDVQIHRRLRQGSDHPVALAFPEGEYLKGLVCRVSQ